MTLRLPAQGCDCGQGSLQEDVGQSGSHARGGKTFPFIPEDPAPLHLFPEPLQMNSGVKG